MERLWRLGLGLACAVASASCVPADVIGREVAYRAGDTHLSGYLAEGAEAEERRPGVLVVHEWWGQNDYARQRARMLAEAGYTGLAVDMYGEGKTAGHPVEAKAFATEAMKDQAVAEARFKAALEYLRSRPGVDPQRIAAIGYCFGGGVVLHMARLGADLKGVVSYHGSLATDTPAGTGDIRARVLVFTGEADRMVPPEQVAAFRDEMERSGAHWRLVAYPGALHSFTNPGADALARRFNLPLAYDEAADRDSWAQTLAFLGKVLAR